MYRAEVIADSVSLRGDRLVTLLLEYPRSVLAEVVTHRRLSGELGEEVIYHDRTTTLSISKSSASSRAIPLIRMIRRVLEDPYIPERFSANGPGMQGHGWLEGADHDYARRHWLIARDEAVQRALMLISKEDRQRLEEEYRPEGNAVEIFRSVRAYYGPSLSVHKQDVNRLLEPWTWTLQVVTADGIGWNNFFALRCHRAAHPAFQKVARMAFLAMRQSRPQSLGYGDWHLPFALEQEKITPLHWYPEKQISKHSELPDPIKFSAARCAWTSYENAEKDGTPEQMLRTFDRLFAEIPIHASPCEHQATPYNGKEGENPFRSNLRGWVQARKLLPLEEIREYSPSDAEIASWNL